MHGWGPQQPSKVGLQGKAFHVQASNARLSWTFRLQIPGQQLVPEQAQARALEQ